MEGGSAHTPPHAPLRKHRVGGQALVSYLFPSSCHRAVVWRIQALCLAQRPPTCPEANSYRPDLPSRFPPTRIPL